MRNFLILLMLLALSSPLLSQINLVVDGHTYSSAYDVPHSSATALTFTNNIFTGSYSDGYQLDAGDETAQSSNNNLDGAVITGNRFIWNGSDASATMHALFTGYNKNVTVKYNYLYRPPLGIIRKSSGMTNTSGGVAYNIIVDPIVGVIAKGMNNVCIYNNTFYSTKSISDTWHGMIDVYMNNDEGQGAYSTNTKIFNNIFYTAQQRLNIYVYETEDLAGFECDYNVYYCASGGPRFQVAGNIYNLTQWQALGYDTHSFLVNPGFIDLTSFVPSSRLNYGTDLGSDWKTGLSTEAVWGTTAPAKTDQNGTWQVGARIYGTSVPVSTITVAGTGGVSTITTDNGTLQLVATVLPANASNPAVTWSVTDGTGHATISTSGLITAVSNGTVTATATAADGTGVSGALVITITNQTIPVTGITVTGAGGATTISADNGTLQLTATVTPSSASNKVVNWTVTNGTGQATINSSGLLSAISNGTVTARATATDGTGISGTLTITISGQIVPVTSISVTGAGGATIITSDNGTLQLTATVLPSGASNKVVTWSIVNGSGQATISSSGLVTAVMDGNVMATASATDGSGITGSLVITISSQIIPVTLITVTGAGGATTISSDNGTLQMSADVQPANATSRNVVWSVSPGTGNASINATGLLSAISNGTVTVTASSTDGSGVTGTRVITLSGQVVPVSSVSVSGEGGATAIFNDQGTLQLYADVLPGYATNKTITWSIENGTGEADISAGGLVSAIANGTITAKASATDGSGIYGTLQITISGQTLLVSEISVTSQSGGSSITTFNGSLQLLAQVLPANATNKSILWSVNNVTGSAIINSNGLLTAASNGLVTAIASSTDGSEITGTLDINIDMTTDKLYSVIVNTDEIRMNFFEDFTTWTVNLYDFMGNLAGRKLVDSNVVTFYRRSSAPGLYLLVLSKHDQIYVEKVMAR
jgi:uncharacterized protein YjdB